MKLKKIEMQGFKSFKDKVILEFNHPIIGVVGPNGSGKSNISDAIRWVLGEQSAKSLRGTKMEDIIFAGTDKVKPLNVAQVSMTFDNREHWIPIDYKEVNITRRVFRTGESEYYINKNQCRLKDVRELFMDTGIGKEGYSIIGQGRIDEILSTKSEDRREIFEEASGISRYKYKKEESLKKLNKTTENLGRINDILSQQLDRIEFLEVEAKKAKKGIYLVDEIKKQEMYISKNESENLRKNIIENEVLLKEQLALLNKCKEDKNNYKNLLKKLKEELHDSEVKYNINKNNLISYESVLYKTENDIRLREEGIKFYENDILRIQREIEKDTEKIKALNSKKDVFSKEILKLEQEVELISSNKFKLNNNIKRIKEEILEYKENLRNLKIELENLNDNINSLEIKSSTSESLSNNKVIEINSKKEKINIINKDINENTLKLNALNDNLQIFISEYNEIISRLKELEQRDFTIKKEKQKIENKLISQKTDKTNLENKLNFYINVKNNYEGYYRQVSNFLKSVEKTQYSNMVVGTLADLIKVKDDYKKVIDILLSGNLQNIVVEDDKDAKILIEYLKKKKIGRLTFLPIKNIKPKSKNPIIKDEDVLAIANEVVICDYNIKNIVDNFLNRTLIVENMEKAIKVSKKYKNAFRIATLDGDLVNTWGSIVGGYKDNKKQSSGLINRNDDIEKLKLNILSLDTSIEELENNILELDEKIIINNNKIDIFNDKLKLNKEEVLKLKEQISEQNTNIKILEHSKEDLNKEINESLICDIFTKEDENKLNELLEKRKSLKEKEEELSEILKEKENLSNKLDIDLITIINKQETKERDILISKNNSIEVEENIATLEENINTNNIELEELYSNLEENKLLIKKDSKKIKDLKLKIEESQKNNNLFKQNYEKARKEYEALRDKESEIKEKNLKIEYKYNLTKNKIDSLIEKENQVIIDILDRYNINIVKYNIDKNENNNYSKDGLKKLKEDLKKLGYFSPDSIIEYESISKEIEFLTNQQNDLLKSKEDILKIINELDEKMTSMFIESLENINKKFERIFTVLFNGGTASLILNSDDILNAGIDIVAEPPGKKLQNLNLLSGGERSLTAVALLFAIFETRPSPFCILDEIDAALDEANIYRYTNYLKDISEKTQIIMITHRKSTMEIADALYGVSMEEKGISKTIVLNLEK